MMMPRSRLMSGLIVGGLVLAGAEAIDQQRAVDHEYADGEAVALAWAQAALKIDANDQEAVDALWCFYAPKLHDLGHIVITDYQRWLRGCDCE